MKIVQVTLDGNAQNLKTAMDATSILSIPNEVSKLVMQNPTGNALVYFGSSSLQVLELTAGDPAFEVPAPYSDGRINLSEIYVKGTNTQKLNLYFVELGKSD